VNTVSVTRAFDIKCPLEEEGLRMVRAGTMPRMTSGSCYSHHTINSGSANLTAILLFRGPDQRILLHRYLRVANPYLIFFTSF
jgi:hypothetical protein